MVVAVLRVRFLPLRAIVTGRFLPLLLRRRGTFSLRVVNWLRHGGLQRRRWMLSMCPRTVMVRLLLRGWCFVMLIGWIDYG